MIRRARDKEMALEYAKSQGWINPGANSFGGIDASRDASAKCVELEGRIAELEARLAAEVESHAVTKRALSRAKGKGRVAELERALRAIMAELEGEYGTTQRACELAVAFAREVLE